MEIKVFKNVLTANEEKAGEIRRRLTEKNIVMINFISSPGAGKTTILEKTIAKLNDKYKVAVIEGDIATDRDAKRLQSLEIPIVLINTEGACHLESISIEKSLKEFDLDNLDIIFIENIGNLVCPAEFDLGEHAKIAVLSTTEGDDKPAKYPLLFRESEAVLLNKVDLLPYVNFNVESFKDDMKKLNGNIPIFNLSAVKEEGMEEWLDWLKARVKNK